MTELIRKVCLFSVLCAAVEMLSIDKKARDSIRVINTAVVSVMILSCLTEVDFSALSLSTARLHSTAAELTAEATETSDRLRRLVIQEEAEEYILNTADKLGISLSSVHVDAEWESENWLPYKVEVYCKTDNADKLRYIIESELGISEERQEWHFEG